MTFISLAVCIIRIFRLMQGSSRFYYKSTMCYIISTTVLWYHHNPSMQYGMYAKEYYDIAMVNAQALVIRWHFFKCDKSIGIWHQYVFIPFCHSFILLPCFYHLYYHSFITDTMCKLRCMVIYYGATIVNLWSLWFYYKYRYL